MSAAVDRTSPVDELAAVVAEGTDASRFPLATAVSDGVLIYDAAAWSGVEGEQRDLLRAELAAALADGPGVFVWKGAFPDPAVVDRATEVFLGIIEEERSAGDQAGDHFGRPGANARIWNAQEKLALTAPDVFVDYFANDAIALASEAWLGPAYQMTSQVNLVYPGGAPQEPHRDYHLGFQSDAAVGSYPMHVHLMSAMLTLQGAVAHCDMPVESGTTMLLPHSQKFVPGYLAYRDNEVRDYFAAHMVQLPLAKGDVLFFNPALLHGAGENRTGDIDRLANLLQVSSAFGRAMESVNRTAMCEAIYPDLLTRTWPEWATRNVIASTAEGYPFPTDLDRDQPVAGLAPPSQATILATAVSEGWAADRLKLALADWHERRTPTA